MDNQITQPPLRATVPLENLEAQLELFIENVRQIELFVSDVQPQGQSVLNQKLILTSYVPRCRTFMCPSRCATTTSTRTRIPSCSPRTVLKRRW
ncbi:uncharacterized protein [Drosophila kikkawai]|uniref:Uncharacterized protein isoform X2 n=1 Tax=Drosophila kikkawai TaxID=30033 RepID=A0ABM4GP59_DROKI